MITKRICIEEHSPSWASTFEELKSMYINHLKDLIIDVQHVGSTSVAGLAAKPVIDIDLIISDKSKLDAIIQQLQLLGYDHLGDLGISDREVFKLRTLNVPIEGYFPICPKHHLYVCPVNSISLKNHIAFRDFLCNHPEKAKAYGDLKKRLAAEEPFNMNRYVESKTPFITAALKEVGFDEQSINKIMQYNSYENLIKTANT